MSKDQNKTFVPDLDFEDPTPEGRQYHTEEEKRDWERQREEYTMQILAEPQKFQAHCNALKELSEQHEKALADVLEAADDWGSNGWHPIAAHYHYTCQIFEERMVELRDLKRRYDRGLSIEFRDLRQWYDDGGRSIEIGKDLSYDETEND